VCIGVGVCVTGAGVAFAAPCFQQAQRIRAGLATEVRMCVHLALALLLAILAGPVASVPRAPVIELAIDRVNWHDFLKRAIASPAAILRLLLDAAVAGLLKGRGITVPLAPVAKLTVLLLTGKFTRIIVA
jgi:hypothetical protein